MKRIVCLSGGVDSGVALAIALADAKPEEVTTCSFNYGSKHNLLETRAAWKIAGYYGVSHRTMNLQPIFNNFKSALMSPDEAVPEGHYEAESMRQTVVPGRNTIFAAVLLGLAQSEGYGEVWMGIHQGDHFIYPDCRPGWLYAMEDVFLKASEEKVVIRAPLLHWTKATIVRRGIDAKFPFQFARTCYTDEEVACGKCGSCQERLAAFATCKFDDPIEYRSRVLLPK